MRHKTHATRRIRSLPSLSSVLTGTMVSLGLAAALLPSEAAACGCFAPPDPSVPIVQAGERILFSHQDGQVTAHIQIQYAGKPGEFGWLLPLPAVPTKKDGGEGIDLGVDELFSQLTTATQPKYRLRRIYETCGSKSRGLGASDNAAEADGGFGSSPPASPTPQSPLVFRESVGPYDAAVLKADNKDAMFGWLKDNKFFVPTGTEDASKPYIRPGAFFLALKLRAGLSAGDLQPVVLRYRSDLPMIPIILTSVAAQPNMGIQVWMLGAGRAIPRNYYHTVVNDAQIDWFTGGQNYNDVIIKAVGEAAGKHSFVTEYAGTSSVMRGLLDAPGRFSMLTALATQTDYIAYVRTATQSGGGFALNGQLTSILSRYIPLPKALADAGISLNDYYQRIDFFLGTDRQANLGKYADIQAALAAFDPAKLTGELRTKIAEPTLDAARAFTDFPYLTRLYSTLSPEDMNQDPVFSYNPGLPDYPNVHEATLTYHCAGFFSKETYADATLETPSGFSRVFTTAEANSNTWTPLGVPFSQQIQALREVGQAEIVVDNTETIRSALSTGGCSSSRRPGPATAGGFVLLLGATATLVARRRREKV